MEIENYAQNHNLVYREKFFGNEITDYQLEEINKGTFNDMYIGDYWEINGHRYRIADFDYFYNKGKNENNTYGTEKHHIILVPDATYQYLVRESDYLPSNDNYVESKIRDILYYIDKSQEPYIKSQFYNDLENYLITHNQLLSKPSEDGKFAMITSDGIELMDEQMIFGNNIQYNKYNTSDEQAETAKVYELTPTFSQFHLFTLSPIAIYGSLKHSTYGNGYWLRNCGGKNYVLVVDAKNHRLIRVRGAENGSEQKRAVRPYICIGKKGEIINGKSKQ